MTSNSDNKIKNCNVPESIIEAVIDCMFHSIPKTMTVFEVYGLITMLEECKKTEVLSPAE